MIVALIGPIGEKVLLGSFAAFAGSIFFRFWQGPEEATEMTLREMAGEYLSKAYGLSEVERSAIRDFVCHVEKRDEVAGWHHSQDTLPGGKGECVSCGDRTIYACAFCRVKYGKIVWLCEKVACREKHESTKTCARS